MECQLGLTPRGILSIKDKEKRTILRGKQKDKQFINIICLLCDLSGL